MSVCTDCDKNKTVTTLQNGDTVCETTVHEEVCVQGVVTIRPKVECVACKSYCIGNPMIGSCSGELKDKCRFTVSQKLCVEIPLIFSATSTAVEKGIVCTQAEIGPCQGTDACTHTIGYFRNHPNITNNLITEAGGFIILGVDDEGLSFTVTTSNSHDVLTFNTPTPPELVPPLYQKYQNLYAQLLAAHLNIVAIEAQGVEIYTFILEAINAANNFLRTSPPEGKTGADDYQEPLELFNSGNAPGCPVHCEE